MNVQKCRERFWSYTDEFHSTADVGVDGGLVDVNFGVPVVNINLFMQVHKST